MIEIRFHGRGGQGVVIASKILASAAAKEGKHVQAFPSFGAERRGAPVAAFTRIHDAPIDLRCQIYQPDHLIILDPSIPKTVDVTAGLKEGGYIVINTPRLPQELAQQGKFRIINLDASHIAAKHRLGPRTAPIVNTAMVGAFAKATGLVSLDSVLKAIQEEVLG